MRLKIVVRLHIAILIAELSACSLLQSKLVSSFCERAGKHCKVDVSTCWAQQGKLWQRISHGSLLHKQRYLHSATVPFLILRNVSDGLKYL